MSNSFSERELEVDKHPRLKCLNASQEGERSHLGGRRAILALASAVR